MFHGKANLIDFGLLDPKEKWLLLHPCLLQPFFSRSWNFPINTSCFDFCELLPLHEEPCRPISLTPCRHFALTASSFLPQRPIAIFISGTSQNVGSRKVPLKLSMSKIDEFCLWGLSFHKRLKTQLLCIHNNAFSNDCTMRPSMICGLRKPTQKSLQATQANPVIS